MSQEQHDKGILEKVKDALLGTDESEPADMPYGGDDAHLTAERRQDEGEEEPVGVASGPASGAESGYTAGSSYETRGTTERETHDGRS
jgi:hypothetical protein